MESVFEKIIEKLEKEKSSYFLTIANTGNEHLDSVYEKVGDSIDKAIEIVKQAAAEYVPDINVGSNGWIPCSVAMPPVETEVFILAKRKYKGGDCKYIITTAMYEDGTVLENDSCWNWEDIDGEWDEKNECYIIPEGWWENRHYNPDEVYNNVVDDEVTAWQPLPAPYQPKGE